jgi:protein TonB
MRDRISKAKAYIAVRNYNAAIYELENIRRETSDSSVDAVTNVLLMNSYLEQGDYKKAGDFLTDLYNQQKTTKPNAGAFYASVSAQVVKSARNQIDRYRALGLTVSDRNLPLEAVNDVERMRETLELVVKQAKEMSADKNKSAAAMGMLEEATNTRSALARDEYDARRWRDEVADSREQLANSRSVITNAVDGTVTQFAIPQNMVAANSNPPIAAVVPAVQQQAAKQEPQAVFRPVTAEPLPKPANSQIAAVETPRIEPASAKVPNTDTQRSRVIPEAPKQETPKQETPPAASNTTSGPAAPAVDPATPLSVGSLIAYATHQSSPIYPAAARTMRTRGVVTVEVTVNEDGDVVQVEKTSGPMMLQSAAKDAIRKWKFKPFTRDGQPVKATGFVNFNFNL